MKLVALYFPDMKTVLNDMLAGKVSKQSTPTLLKMLTDDSTRFSLEIELSAIIENLSFLQELKGMATWVFKLENWSTSSLYNTTLERGGLCNMLSTNWLINKAVLWAQANNLQPSAVPALRQTIRQVQEAARGAAGNIVCQTTNAYATDASQLEREAIER
jgi:hypothetical protein